MIDWNHVGNRLHLERDRPADAERAYRRAIRADPGCARPWNGLGILLADRLGRPEEGEAAFRRAIGLDPGFAAPWNGLGIYQHEELCRPDLAYASFLRAIELDRADPTFWYNLAGVLRAWTRDCAGATRACRTALALDDGDPFAWMAWGELALVRGERGAALDRLARAATAMATRTDPQAAVLCLSLATSLGHGGEAARWAPVVARVAEGAARPLEAALALAIHAAATGNGADESYWRARCLAALVRHRQRAWALAECYGVAGLRPDLRETLADVARQLFAAAQRPHPPLAGTPTPEAMLLRFRRFTFGGGLGAGDPLDRPLWCREADAAWLTSGQEVGGDTDGLGEADPADLDARRKGAVKPTRH